MTVDKTSIRRSGKLFQTMLQVHVATITTGWELTGAMHAGERNDRLKELKETHDPDGCMRHRHCVGWLEHDPNSFFSMKSLAHFKHSP